MFQTDWLSWPGLTVCCCLGCRRRNIKGTGQSGAGLRGTISVHRLRETSCSRHVALIVPYKEQWWNTAPGGGDSCFSPFCDSSVQSLSFRWGKKTPHQFHWVFVFVQFLCKLIMQSWEQNEILLETRFKGCDYLDSHMEMEQVISVSLKSDKKKTGPVFMVNRQ